MALFPRPILLMLVLFPSVFRYSPPMRLSKLSLSVTTCKQMKKLSHEWAQALSWTFQTCFPNYLVCIHPVVPEHSDLNGSEFNYHCGPPPTPANTCSMFSILFWIPCHRKWETIALSLTSAPSWLICVLNAFLSFPLPLLSLPSSSLLEP